MSLIYGAIYRINCARETVRFNKHVVYKPSGWTPRSGSTSHAMATSNEKQKRVETLVFSRLSIIVIENN